MVKSFFSKVARRIKTSVPASVATPLAAATNNPWNANEPVSYDGMWLGCNTCVKHIQRKVSGDENTHWLTYAVQKYLGGAIGQISADKDRTEYRCLILGANEGHVERELCQHGFIGEIVASDIADKALARAAEKSKELGYENITYVVADLNGDLADLPGMFDFIIFEGVLHHIVKIEECLQHLQNKLLPGGLMLGVEFHGAFRFQLPEHQVKWINAALATIPKSLRPFPRDEFGMYPASPQDNLRVHYVAPTAESIEQIDPSEAICGFKLKQLFTESFEVLEQKGFGGVLLSYMTGHFDFKRANEDPFADTWLKNLIQIEDTLIETGILEDEYIFWALKKKD
ncbi:bifunctional 2-polyprenyl-6-hydroxyphenol methylase/3-demethylubiquinol 3-O-methyltransferase UbiG [Halomicronema sp. CCY15110]|uniref:class I SAM-dependent methyltransferase n=1 Tax=Halomicronema sp. CCY15110 TaxID=2767773 RepID=UPI001951BC5A|nr:class I SAM-dependent methyltransferase [Halomicronema sp. CCY15110]